MCTAMRAREIHVCLGILVLVSCICFVIFNVNDNVFYKTRSKISRRFRESNHSAREPAPQEKWRPDPETIRTLLSHLNLTTDEARRALPQTLRAELLLSNASLCGTGPVDFLFMVHTAPSHLDRRRRYRRTFMSADRFLPLGVTVRRVFLLGRVENQTLQTALAEEHRQFGDLVQGDFLDAYRNLTLKGVMGYGWMTRYCPRARLVIKTDDDVFFDTFKFISHYWAIVRDKRRSIFCSVFFKLSMPILRAGKWEVDNKLFFQQGTFPYDYCSGPLVLISGDLIPWLFKAAEVTPFFWIDDVYLFGILPAVASNVSFFDLNVEGGQMVSTRRWHELKCLQEDGYDCPLAVANHYNDAVHFEAVWNISVKRYGLSYLTALRRPTVIV